MTDDEQQTRRGSGDTTRRRKRQVTWAKRLRRVGLMWQNGLEIARAGRLTAPYGHPFEVVYSEPVFRLRHYRGEAEAGAVRVATPVLLVPPLMVASEVYDIAPDVSVVAHLIRSGVDVWLVDFGKPEDEEGGLARTLDDHVRAASVAVDKVREATGHDVHLTGYSQGGMFAYQTAAFRKSRGIASIITFGSPVDLHRTVPKLADHFTARLTDTLQLALRRPIKNVEGLPGFLTSTGFKLLSARKEVQQMFDFVRNLHDRQALEKREAKRMFLAGDGFVAWPGPAFRKFVDDLIVANRLASGGFVIDGHSVTLADLTCPIIYFVGDRDEMGRPAAVRGIRRAAPNATPMIEVMVRAGHFGLVVGSTALTRTWPTAVAWMRWREGNGELPEFAVDVRATPLPEPVAAHDLDADLDDDDPYDDDTDVGDVDFDLGLAQDLISKTASAVVERIGDLSHDLERYFDNLRWQMPRINRLRNMQDDTLISFGRVLADRARDTPEQTFFLWRGRAFTYAEVNRRIDAVTRGLIASGIKSGTRVGVMMLSRPSLPSLVAAISRLGAVAVLLSPDLPATALPRALELGEVDVLVSDPEHAAAARAGFMGKVLMLGGVGEVPFSPGQTRVVPDNVVDLETIDPTQVAVPGWFRPDLGRARDLAMIFVTSNPWEGTRASRITNRRWAFSALGAAAACNLTHRDTVYCCLPLHHPGGLLVAVGSALVGGTRLALAAHGPAGSGMLRAASFDHTAFWDEIRRYGVSVVYYSGELGRSLVDAPSVLGEQNNSVRLFAGSGMRVDVWPRLVDRFGPVGVLEFYASTEANAVLANAAGTKIGAVGKPLPGSPEMVCAAWNFDNHDFIRDFSGHLVRARLDEPGMLVAKLHTERGPADIAHIDPKRLLRDAFATGDTWFVTGEFMRLDEGGDFWRVDRLEYMLRTDGGPVASTRIEDALYQVPGLARCAVIGIDAGGFQAPVAAIVLVPGATVDWTKLAVAVMTLPAFARPRRIKVVDDLPATDGYRLIKRAVAELDFGHDVHAWDPAHDRFVEA